MRTKDFVSSKKPNYYNVEALTQSEFNKSFDEFQHQSKGNMPFHNNKCAYTYGKQTII